MKRLMFFSALSATVLSVLGRQELSAAVGCAPRSPQARTFENIILVDLRASRASVPRARNRRLAPNKFLAGFHLIFRFPRCNEPAVGTKHGAAAPKFLAAPVRRTS